MLRGDLATTETEAVFEVQLRRRPDASLWSQYPAVAVQTTEPVTALRSVSGPEQLDELLQRLRSVGLVLMDVHRATSAADDPLGHRAVHEVRVRGVLGEALLRYLRWPHYVIPAETRLRITMAPADLLAFLQACTAAGAGIEQIHRVDDARAPQPAVA
jgi:hypothetical protein